MFRLRTFAAGLALALTTSSAVQAALIADYRGEYLAAPSNTMTRPSVSADGWDYMWNANLPIGTAAGNYSSLLSWGSTYNFDGLANVPRPDPAGYAYVHGTGGHPGRGSSQGATFDRFPITAYTLQAGEGGLIQVTNSALSVGSTNSTGVELRVYVNDTLATRFVRSGGGVASSFNGVLGILSPGDTVYVAMGPNATDGSDSFNVAYQLETVTDTSVVVWDADGTLPIDGGTGPWNTAAPARWYTGSGGGTYTTWSNAGNLNANFLASGGTVTLAEPITARSLTFSADGYTIDGSSTLTLTTGGSGGPGPATISVVSDTDTATISAPVSASNLTKVDSGTLRLTGNLSVSKLTAAGGNLTLAGTATASLPGGVSVGRNTFGTLNIQDSASLTSPAGTYFMLGDSNGVAGNVNQSGGTVQIDGQIRIAHWPGGPSTYALSDGTLAVASDLNVGWDGVGVFSQSGGQASANRIVVNANTAGGSGTFTLSGGTFTLGSGGITTVAGPAAVTIGGAGGTLKASASFSSALNMTITGGAKNGAYFDTNSYNIDLSGNLTGGGDLNKVGDGTLTLSGAANALGRIYAAGGNLVFDSGSSTTSSGMQVGANDYFVTGGGSGTATVQGTAVLTTGSIVMGDNYGGPTQANFFNQTGGTVNVTGYSTDGGAPSPNQGGLRIGHWPNETSNYNLSGGTLNLQNPAAGIMLATDGNGTFHQTGGTANAAFVKMNTRTSGSGTGIFTLEGGTFELGSGGIVTDAGPYQINLGGGTNPILRAVDSWSSSLNMTLSGIGGTNAITFDTNGHDVTLSGVLSGGGELMKTGAGTLILSGDNNALRGLRNVAAGTVRVLHNNAMGNASMHADVQSGATLELVGGLTGVVKTVFLKGSGVGGNGALRSLSGHNVYAGGVNIGSAPNATIGVDADSLTLNNGIGTWPDPNRGITKVGAGTLILNGTSNYAGSTLVNDGTLVVDGSIAASSGVNVAAGAILAGHGTVPDISGAGLVSPGNSPGILTVQDSVDGSGGLDFAFEFTREYPDYGDPADSLNDVLRLTDPSYPFTADMAAGNVVDIYLNVTDLAVGDTFRGGFYTDRPTDFLDQIEDATFNIYVAGAGGGVHFEGVDYFPLDEYLPVSGFQISTVYDPADFLGGGADGYVMQLTGVPEPASLVLAAMGLALLAWVGRRRFARKA